jgi:hypothetical protein
MGRPRVVPSFDNTGVVSMNHSLLRLTMDGNHEPKERLQTSNRK